jgi:hypothetical protein
MGHTTRPTAVAYYSFIWTGATVLIAPGDTNVDTGGELSRTA